MTRNEEAKAKVMAAFAGKSPRGNRRMVVPGDLVTKNSGRYAIATHSETPGWIGYYADGVLVHEDGDTFPTFLYEEDVAR